MHHDYPKPNGKNLHRVIFPSIEGHPLRRWAPRHSVRPERTTSRHSQCSMSMATPSKATNTRMHGINRLFYHQPMEQEASNDREGQDIHWSHSCVF